MVVSRLNSQALSGKSIKTVFCGAIVFSIVKPQNCELKGFSTKIALRLKFCFKYFSWNKKLPGIRESAFGWKL